MVKKNIKDAKMKKKYKRCTYSEKKFLHRAFSVCCFMVVLTIGVVACAFLFFRIEKITVYSSNMYSTQDIITGSELKTGTNLFLANSKNIEKKLTKNLPYIKTIKLVHIIPNKIEIHVKETYDWGAFQYENQNFIIDSDGKILAKKNIEETLNIPIIKGISLNDTEIGEIFKIKNNNITAENLIYLFNKLNEYGIQDLKDLDFTDNTNILINFQDRIKINLGYLSDIDYKLRTATAILKNKINTQEHGILNLSSLAEENRSYFSPLF